MILSFKVTQSFADQYLEAQQTANQEGKERTYPLSEGAWNLLKFTRDRIL